LAAALSEKCDAMKVLVLQCRSAIVASTVARGRFAMPAIGALARTSF